MKPVRPLDANMVYQRPPSRPDIGDLHCIRVKPGRIRSQWRLDVDELAYLIAGGNIELEILGEPIPPVSLNICEAFCPECMVVMKMEWRAAGSETPAGGGAIIFPAHWHFRCPSCGRWA